MNTERETREPATRIGGSIGALIANVLKGRGLSVETLASRTGIPAYNLSRYLHGRRAVPLEDLMAIAGGLQLSAMHLVLLATRRMRELATVEPGPDDHRDTQRRKKMFAAMLRGRCSRHIRELILLAAAEGFCRRGVFTSKHWEELDDYCDRWDAEFGDESKRREQAGSA